MQSRTTLDPSTLASLLDRWALRREKVLELLDLRAAARARDLASACQEFSVWRERADVTDLDAHFVWLELRRRALKMLEEAQRGAPASARSSAEAAQSAAAPSAQTAVSRSGRSSAVSGTRRVHAEADLELDPRHERASAAPTPTAGRGR